MISAITCTSATVSWDGVDDATQYQVQWMLINDPSRMVNGSRTASASLTSYTLTRLIESSEYTVQVTSLSNQIRGDSSPPVTFTVSCGSDNNGNRINGK